MKCKKCKSKNVYYANYCVSCGEEISKKEREVGYKATFWGRLEQLEDIYKTITLSKFLDSKPVRIIVIVAILTIGIWNLYVNGRNMRIKESEQYAVQYNKNADEYYLITPKDKISLEFYFPHDVDKLKVVEYDNENNIVEENENLLAEELVLESNTDNHYVFTAKYTNGEEEKQTVYIFGE